MKQMTTNQALVCYSLGGLTAFAGWFNNMFAMAGITILFIISVSMTVGGD